MNAQGSFDFSKLTSSNGFGYDVDESSFTHQDTAVPTSIEECSPLWEIQPNIVPGDMNLTGLDGYGGEPYFGYPTSSDFSQIPTTDELDGYGNMTEAFVNTFEDQGSSQPATADSACAQPRDDGTYSSDQVDMCSMALADSGFPPVRLSESPSQSHAPALDDQEDDITPNQATPIATPVPTPQIEEIEVETVIGTIRLNGNIMCQHADCRQPFGRLAELKRHYATAHAVQKPEYWCSQPLCDRSVAGGRPFHRKDKTREHERKVHHRGVYRKRR